MGPQAANFPHYLFHNALHLAVRPTKGGAQPKKAVVVHMVVSPYSQKAQCAEAKDMSPRGQQR